jgi:hypothetical protein
MLLPCNCCGYLIFSEDEYYEICPVCYWERWPDETTDVDTYVGTNSYSLRESQRNFLLFGAVSEGYDLDFTSERCKEYSLDRAPGWQPIQPFCQPPSYASRVMCRCCGYCTVFVGSERCEICGWEYSPQQNDPDDDCGPNLFTLRQSQESFRQIGVKEKIFLGHLRLPTLNDLRNAKLIQYEPPKSLPSRAERQFSRRREPVPSNCPCCGYLGISGSYPYCRYCRWKFSPQQEQPDDPIGPNFISLRAARRNFAEFGACKRDELKNVVKPAADVPRLLNEADRD